MLSRQLHARILLVALGLLLAACQAGMSTESPTSTPEIRPSATIPPTALPTETETPLPTVVPEEAQKRIAELMKTNGGCLLPCWWGVTPGKTSMETVNKTLARFVSDVSPFPDERHLEGYAITFGDPETPAREYRILFYTAGEIVEKIDTFSFDPLAHLLEQYGIPEEVWLHSGGYSMGFQPPSFSLALLYPEQGVMIYYQERSGGYLSEGGTDYVQICPNDIRNAGNPGLYLWPTGHRLSFAEILPDIYPKPELVRYEPLEDVSNMDEESFYDAFTNPESSACLKTPADIWP